MPTYRFKAANWPVAFLTPVLVFIIGLFCIVPLYINGYITKGFTLLNILIAITFVLLLFYSNRWTAFAKVEVTVGQNSLSIKWLQAFLFFKRKDATIVFNE